MKNSELGVRPNNITSNSETRGNGNNEQNNKSTSSYSKLRVAIAFFTVEPVLFIYMLSSGLSSIAVQRLHLEKACRVDLGHTKKQCDDWDGNITTAVQRVVLDIETWQTPLTSAAPVIILLFIGAWSDRTGTRKALLFIPVFGELVSSLGLVLTTHYFEEWPLFTTALIESLPTAFTGGFPVILMGSYSYLADLTSVESRTVRNGIAVIILELGSQVASSLSEILADSIGFYGIFGLATALNLFGLLYTYFRIQDVNPINVEETWYRKLIKFFHPNNAWDTLCIAFKRGPHRMKTILVLAVHIVFIGPEYGQSSMLYPYIITKYSIDSDEVTAYYTYGYLVSICGVAIAIVLFCKYMKFQDAILGIIATTGKVLSSVVCAVAPSKSWFYVGSFLDIFGNAGFTAIRSLATKVVAPKDIGKMCSLIGLVDTIIPLIYTPLFSEMYNATENSFLGAFLLLGAAVIVPAYYIFITLYLTNKKEERDRVQNPERKERYVHENDVTEF